MGTLKITDATLDTAQFGATSDADSFRVGVQNAQFTFVSHSGSRIDVTQLFHQAFLMPKKQRPCISSKNEISVRLQGVDAPELSFVPTLARYGLWDKYNSEQRNDFCLYNEKCRQAMADPARRALQAYLKPPAGTTIQVEVNSAVNLPGDLLDAYGRFIGDVVPIVGGKPKQSLALWLAENGWAFPSYYVSMDPTEIQAIDKASDLARAGKGKGLWPHFDKLIPPIVPNANYAPAAPPHDRLTLPKLYRRQAAWWAGAQAGLWSLSFRDYLTMTGETLMLKCDFLEWRAAARRIPFADILDAGGVLTQDPASLVFPEKASHLYTASGDEILSWSPPNTPNKVAPGNWPVLLAPKLKSATVEWVNSVAISHDGQCLLGGTFKYDYEDSARLKEHLGIYCYDGQGNPRWQDFHEFWGGVFMVALSQDGNVAAATGWHDRTHGLLRAYDVSPAHLTQQGAYPKTAFLLDCNTIGSRVNSVSLSANAQFLAAAADRVYLFKRNQGGKKKPHPYSELPGHPALIMGSGVTSVALHPSGSWLVACSKRGAVLFAEVSSTGIGNAYTWQALGKPVNRTLPASAIAPINLNCVAIAPKTGIFATCGGDFVFVYSKEQMLALQEWVKDGRKSTPPPFPVELDLWSGDSPISRKKGGPADNVRWLALSEDGHRLAVVVNRVVSRDKRGMAVLFDYSSAKGWRKSWERLLPHFPNCVSMDPKGTRIAIAYGYPEKQPGGFSLLDASGDELWHYQTKDMNWPIAFSGDGQTIAAGGDDGYLYCFKP